MYLGIPIWLEHKLGYYQQDGTFSLISSSKNLGFWRVLLCKLTSIGHHHPGIVRKATKFKTGFQIKDNNFVPAIHSGQILFLYQTQCILKLIYVSFKIFELVIVWFVCFSFPWCEQIFFCLTKDLTLSSIQYSQKTQPWVFFDPFAISSYCS